MPALKQVDVEYDLPPAIKSLREGWLFTLQGSAVTSSVTAAVEAQLLVFYSDVSNFAHRGSTTQNAVKILTYIALICSISATMTALLLTDEFGEISTRAARNRDRRTEGGKTAGTDWGILRMYQIREHANWIVYHWMLSLATACLCTIASTATYAGTQEPLTTTIIVSIVAVLSILPLCWLLFPKRLQPETARSES
ncbi:hypothetical protein PENSPDRAFT_113862 [Peniophora sp. CONT]|nr:hypothetical protein PENSPDRAFT_113862 [Peniophora sp. CONT]